MRLRLRDEAFLYRRAGLIFWFGPAAWLTCSALHLGWLPVAALIVGLLGINKHSPLGFVARRLERRLARQLARGGRAELVGTRSVVDPLVALLAAGTLWIVPLCAGAYAYKNESGYVVAVAILALTLLGVGRLVLGRPATALTLGVDGVRLPGHGFVPYAAIEDTRVQSDDVCVTWAGRMERFTVGGTAGVIVSELERRRALPVAPAPSPASEVAVHARIADVPPDLVATLRDGAAPREERVRVAEVLRIAAPAEVDRLLEETADEELAARLRRR